MLISLVKVLKTAQEQGRTIGADGATAGTLQIGETGEQPTWRKANGSFSDGNCVELAMWKEERLIRDSKNPNGGVLSLSPKSLKAFLKSIQKGKFGN